MKIALLKDGKKQIATINPFDGRRVWVKFDKEPGKSQLYKIEELRAMFNSLYQKDQLDSSSEFYLRDGLFW